MKEINTEIEINGSIDTVWEILTDFNSYPEWNSFIKKIEGKLKVGAQLKVYIEPPGGKGMTFKPKVIKLVPNSELRWLGQFLFPGLFDGEHIFELQKIDNIKVRFLHRENFNGLLVPLLWKSLNTNTRQGL